MSCLAIPINGDRILLASSQVGVSVHSIVNYSSAILVFRNGL